MSIYSLHYRFRGLSIILFLWRQSVVQVVGSARNESLSIRVNEEARLFVSVVCPYSRLSRHRRGSGTVVYNHQAHVHDSYVCQGEGVIFHWLPLRCFRSLMRACRLDSLLPLPYGDTVINLSLLTRFYRGINSWHDWLGAPYWLERLKNNSLHWE